MSVENIECMFAPRTIAVVGASDKPASVGTLVMKNLAEGGFTGRIFPVNAHYKSIGGHPAYKSVKDIPRPVDLVIVATPIQTVPKIIRDCAKMGFGGAVIISAGGKEIGEKGAALEAQICEAIHGTNFRVIGPNCLGIITPGAALNAGIASRMPAAGKMALLSQSGAICTSILDFAVQEHIGFSHFVSLGSMLDVDFGDMIDYLGSDPKVSSILMYCENLPRIRNFMSAARAVSRIKPIIALKAGRTAGGACAAAIHTGVSAGEDAVYDAAFKRAGIVRVRTFAELFDCAEFIGKQRRPKGNGLAILTNAGGPGVMAADALGDYGVAPAILQPETIQKLNQILPANWSRANPVDILGDAGAERFALAAGVLTEAREVDGLLIILAPRSMTGPGRVAHALAAQLTGTSFPVFTAWLGGADVQEGRSVFNKAGIPTFDSPERAVRAFMDLHQYSRNIEMLQQIPSKLPARLDFDREVARAIIRRGIERGCGLLPESEAKQLLAAYGIVFDDQPVQKDYGLTAGARRNPEFGPVLYFGIGGVFKEAYNDRSIALPPLNRILARRMMEETRIYQVISANEGEKSPAVLDVEALLICLSQLVTDFAELAEIEISPLLIHEGRAVAAGIRVAVAPAPVAAPLHLSISAYPNQYEEEINIEEAGRFMIRPIRPEDAPLLESLFASLSPKSVYFRFFAPLKQLPHHMLARFTQIDYDRQIALVAISSDGEAEKMIGVSRIIVEPDQKSAEFSIVVADALHGKGIGAALLKRCLAIAREKNLEKIWAMVLPDNTKMLALGKKLGFEVKRYPAQGECILNLNLCDDAPKSIRWA